MPHTLSPDEYRAVLRSIPLNQDRYEVRLLAIVLTGSLMFGVLRPLFYLLTVPASPIYKVNGTTTLHWLVPLLFFAGASLALPHLVVLL
ncbi:MAG: hypothetical protein EOO27_23330, partial [Comamonadaceae bacterium]